MINQKATLSIKLSYLYHGLKKEYKKMISPKTINMRLTISRFISLLHHQSRKTQLI